MPWQMAAKAHISKGRLPQVGTGSEETILRSNVELDAKEAQLQSGIMRSRSEIW